MSLEPTNNYQQLPTNEYNLLVIVRDNGHSNPLEFDGIRNYSVR